ncbi:MAG: HlyD family efflux transporter periplasmic adaptor subunit [Rhodospirillales bacterium]|nr:HlyD family efflux transporter periplasmic adaptor subunit [Rhodospirillales bacterium]MDE2198180.1 HlyD family efflux transporter periplasmic adaptor subunit [Rhodospirillales bacterium]MDE2573804.1 HlyD family efflux transporter periplasmic adaptor subunit [Rhodospirillales bacterium]
MSLRPRIALLVLLVLALAGGIAWRFLPHGLASGSARLTLYGDIDIREVRPAFNDSGHIAAMLVQEGAVVTRGQLLATLDDTRYAAGLAQAKAQAENQRQVLAGLLAGSRPEQIAQAKAAMDAQQVIYRNDAANYRRALALATANAGTIRQRDDAKAALDAAGQQYEAARQAWILAVKGPRAEDVAAARAAWQAAEAAVVLAQRQFDDTRLHAPADGVIEDRILEPGDMASPATPVFTMALPSPLWVRAYVPESDLGRIRPGMAAEVSTDSYPAQVYHGWIGYLSPTAEFTPKTVETPELRTALVYQLRVYVCDARGELRLGMPATVRIDPAGPAGAPPADCVPGHAAGP